MPAAPWNSETARAAARLGALARKRNRDVEARLSDLSARVAKLERNGHKPGPKRATENPAPALPAMPPAQPLPAVPPEDPSTFAFFRLERVRAMLTDLDARIRAEGDPLAVDRLARAARTLHDQWCDLSGHSRAGQRRPGRERLLPAGPVRLAPLGRADDDPPEHPAAQPAMPPPAAPAAGSSATPANEPPPE